jgi:hypothetical protein
MKSSNLAERLEQYEAEIDTLNLARAPSMRRLEAASAAGEDMPRATRRRSHRPGLQIRDQGLRPFRVF